MMVIRLFSNFLASAAAVTRVVQEKLVNGIAAASQELWGR